MTHKQPVRAIKKEWYPIPSDLSPVGYRCVTVKLPDSDDYAVIFRGALATLEKWWNYQRTGDNQGSQVATLWREAFLDLDLVGNCNVIQFRYLACDLLEFSVDGGENWYVVADFENCFPALHPETTARNIIQPTVPTVIPLTIMGQNSQVAYLQSWNNYLGDLLATVLADGSGEFRGYLQAGNPSLAHFKTSAGISGEQNTDFYGHGGLSYLRFWSSFSGQLLWLMESAYFDPTRFYIYANGQKSTGLTLRDDGKLGLGIDTPLARQHIKAQSSTERGQIIQAAAAQAYNLQELRKSDGTLYAGADQIGRYFMALTSGEPTDMTAISGTILIDPDAQKVWVKGDSGWFDVSGGFAAGDYIKRVPTGAYNEIRPATVNDWALDIYMPEGSTKNIFSASAFDGRKVMIDHNARLVLSSESSIPATAAGNARLIYCTADGGLYLSKGLVWERVNIDVDAFVRTNPDSTTQNDIEPVNTTTVPLTVRAVETSTLPIVRFADETGVLSSIDRDGRLELVTYTDQPAAVGGDGVIAYGINDQALLVAYDDEWRKVYQHNSVKSPIQPFFHNLKSRPAAGNSIEFDVFVPSKLLVLPIVIETGDTLEFTQIVGWWSYLSTNITNPSGGWNAFGEEYYTGTPTSAGSSDPVPSENFMALLVRYNQSTGLNTIAVTEALEITISDYDNSAPGIWMFPNVDPTPYAATMTGGVRVHIKFTAHA